MNQNQTQATCKPSRMQIAILLLGCTSLLAFLASIFFFISILSRHSITEQRIQGINNELSSVKAKTEETGSKIDNTLLKLGELTTTLRKSTKDFSEKTGTEDFLSYGKQADETSPTLAALYYQAGAMQMKDKREIFSAFITWSSSRIRKALEKDNIEEAEELLTNLSETLDNNIFHGTVQSIESYEDLLNRIEDIEAEIIKYRANLTESQIVILKGVSEKIQKFNPKELASYQKVVEDLTQLESKSVSDDVAVQVELTLAKAQQYVEAVKACSNSTSQNVEIQFPPEDCLEALPFWIENLKSRWDNEEILLDKKLQELEQVDQFLSALKKDTPEKEAAAAAVDILGNNLLLRNWQRGAQNFIQTSPTGNSENYNITGSALLTEGKELNQTIKDPSIKNILCDISAKLYHHNLESLKIKGLWAQKQGYKPDFKMEIYSNLRFRSYDLLLEAKQLENEFGTTDLLFQVKQSIEMAIDAFGGLVEAEQLKNRMSENERAKLIEARFLAFATGNINAAEQYYQKAEAVAGEWLFTWNDRDAQKYLDYAFQKLFDVDLKSLEKVNAPLANRWSEVFEKIKEQYLEKENIESIRIKHENKGLEDFE